MNNRKAIDNVVIFKCRHGYVLEGDERSVCLPNVTWSALPSCKRMLNIFSLLRLKILNISKSLYIFNISSCSVRGAADLREYDTQTRHYRRNSELYFW